MTTMTKTRLRPAPRLRRQSGFTIIELMIAIALSLISIVLLTQVLSATSQSRKQIVGGGDADTSALLAAAFVERDLRQAGHGINFLPFLGCSMAVTDSTTGQNFSTSLLPLFIVNGGVNTLVPDSIRIQYSTNDSGHTPARATSAESSSLLQIDNRFGFRDGELLVTSDGTTANGCAMWQATGATATSGTGGDIAHTGGRYNGAVGKALLVPGGFALPLGGAFVDRNIAVANNQLTGLNRIAPDDTSAPTTPTQLVDGIVAIKAEFLLTASDASIPGSPVQSSVEAGWNAATLTGDANIQTNWPLVRAVRYSIISRSKEASMEWAANPASATLQYFSNIALPATSATVCSTSCSAPARTVALTADQRRYKYIVRESVIPMRNNIWGGQ